MFFCPLLTLLKSWILVFLTRKKMRKTWMNLFHTSLSSYWFVHDLSGSWLANIGPPWIIYMHACVDCHDGENLSLILYTTDVTCFFYPKRTICAETLVSEKINTFTSELWVCGLLSSFWCLPSETAPHQLRCAFLLFSFPITASSLQS